jgi:predicted MPP superfamily phosphohydrolase
MRDRRVSRRRFLRLASAAGAGGLIGFYPIFIERYIVLVNRYRIPVPHLPEAFAGFIIVHLTDLHYGALVPLSLIRSVVQRANRLSGDTIVCTGDYIHERNSTVQIDQVWPVLYDLRAKQGVYSSLGNHDHWGNTDRSVHWLERSGQSVRHRARSIERGGEQIWIAGGGDLWEDHRSFDVILRDVPEGDCRIVLAHNPDSADTDFSARIDLMLSGHTHGGQVRLPCVGAPVLPVKNKRYSSGLMRSDRGMRLFISRGIGWAVYPVRFNCYPEIAVLELVPDAPQETK